MAWTAEVTNNPDRGFGLYIELLEGDQYRARLQRGAAGELEVVFYGGEECAIPWTWLAGVAARFVAETGVSGTDSGRLTDGC